MNSLTQDPWISENSTTDDYGIVELFLKSLDSSQVVSSSHKADTCWNPLLGSTEPTTADKNFTPDKVGYESFSHFPSVTSVFTQTIKQEQCFGETCDQSPHCGLQCLPSLYQYTSLHHSAQLQGLGQSVAQTASENWLSSNYTSNFEALKGIPERPVVCQDNAFQNVTNSQSIHSIRHLKVEVQPTYLCNQVRCKFESGSSQPCEQLQLQPGRLVEGSQLQVPDPKIFSQHTPSQVLTNEVVVKQEPPEDAMNLSGHFMCHPMFMMNPSAPPTKCGCGLPKCQSSSHFMCSGTSKSGMSMEQYGEFLKRGSAALLGESQPKSLAPQQSIRSDKERPFTCEECGKSFLLKHHLVTHSRVHSGLRPYGCSDCGKTFAHKHCLVTHQRLHSGQRPFQCIECKKSFTLKHHLVTHSRTHSKDRPFHCEECGRTFAQKRNLVTHAKLHSGERPFQCALCGECFSQREHLLAHSRFHGGESAFVCVDCGEAFARKFQLVDHRRQHGHSPYACTTCGKEFLQKRTLIAHTKLHDEAGPYSCKHCSQSFPCISDLVAHSRIHNSFSCKECGCNFPTNEDFVIHLQHHNPSFSNNRQSTSQTKPFTCMECGSGFAQKHGLVQHMNKKHANSSSSSNSLNKANFTNKAHTVTLAQNCDIMEHIKHQVLSEQLKAKIQ